MVILKDLSRRATDKILCNKAFANASNQQYDEYQYGLHWIIVYFIKSQKYVPLRLKLCQTKELHQGEELHQSFIKNWKNEKYINPFKDNILGADLADMQLTSRFNKEIQFLLHLIDINSKYGWVVPLKDEKNITATNKFEKILNASGCKSNEIW